MAEFRMRYGALFTSRRFHASATVSVSVVMGSQKPAPAGLREGNEPGPEVEDQPELRTQWRVLPRSIRPDEWVTETAVKHVPGSLLIAEEQRRPEGYYPCYGT
ncbi:MAG: hypothetical protein ACRDQV_07000 [Pseudonocardiaceae bacterium]